jgi:hypothetical protein
MSKIKETFLEFWKRCATPNLLSILLMEDGRKVGFASWVFIVSTHLVYIGKISADMWFLLTMGCMAVITGGTLADKNKDIEKMKLLMKDGTNASPAA